ncbi:MAG: ClbS/DfsB family four-helix bundle protein [Saprospiraceae bacterium]
MARPKSKSDLLELSQSNFQKLYDFIEQKSREEQLKEFPKGTLNRNIRDVLVHLHHWHLMMLDWYKVGMSGKKPEMPAKGYTWKNTPELNKWIWGKYQDLELKKAKSLLKKSYQDFQKIIEQHSDQELFEKKKYHWTGSTSLAAYLISATSSHYDWAFKLIRKSTK